MAQKFDSLDQFDAPLRFRPGDWALDWYVANRRAVSAYVNHSSPPDAIQPLADMLGAKFAASNARELWIPMGVGRSADHELTRNACIQALQQAPELFEKFDVYLYQEVPYLAEFPDHAQRILREIQDAGGALTPECFDARDVIAQKFRLVSIFGSQFKSSHMSAKVAAAAHASAAGTDLKFAELSFRMTALPRAPMADALYSGRVQIDATVRRLKRWYPRSCKATRVRIACPTGVGRWRDDMQQLLQAFPAATFEIHLPADGMDETRAFQSDRITVHPVPGGRSGWLACVAGLLRSPHLPLIVVTGFRFAKLAPLVKAGLFPARLLPVSSIDSLVNALREVRS